jgi:hypothetical protein
MLVKLSVPKEPLEPVVVEARGADLRNTREGEDRSRRGVPSDFRGKLM